MGTVLDAGGAGLTPVLSLPRQFQCCGEMDREQQLQGAVLRTLAGLGVPGARESSRRWRTYLRWERWGGGVNGEWQTGGSSRSGSSLRDQRQEEHRVSELRRDPGTHGDSSRCKTFTGKFSCSWVRQGVLLLPSKAYPLSGLEPEALGRAWLVCEPN